MDARDLLATFLAVACFAGAQTPNPCSFTSGGKTVSLSGLNTASGNLAVTPLGNVQINPCAKVTLCDAMQFGSACCVQVNDTRHPGTSRWISCGVNAKPAVLGTTARAGLVLEDGPDCGYVFAPDHRVQASIAFVCDQTATGSGSVSADTTNFMKQAAASTAGGGAVAPGAPGKAAAFDPSLFCNLNFTWKTSLVCGLPQRVERETSNWGWTLLLLALGFGGIYFVGGTFYRAQQTGADPSFW